MRALLYFPILGQMGKRKPKGPWLTRVAWAIGGLCAVLGSMGGCLGGLLHNLRTGVEDIGWIIGGALIGLVAGILLKRFVDLFE